MAVHQFELVGGDPALNFLNTIHDWTAPERRDYLTDYAAVLRFGEAVGLLLAPDIRRLSSRSAGVELRRLRVLRGGMERIFRAVVESRAPGAADLDALAREAALAARATRLRQTHGRLSRYIDVEQAGVATLRWRIVEAAISLLTSPSPVLHRVKACPSCGWFFKDETKSGTRRWCRMATCGSIAKSRRYYWRTRHRSRP
jgi:predicted RNA-binding Zn ribbon-like protein